eukprot:4741974-Heterocapsa_arctica.AAC.1
MAPHHAARQGEPRPDDCGPAVRRAWTQGRTAGQRSHDDGRRRELRHQHDGRVQGVRDRPGVH